MRDGLEGALLAARRGCIGAVDRVDVVRAIRNGLARRADMALTGVAHRAVGVRAAIAWNALIRAGDRAANVRGVSRALLLWGIACVAHTGARGDRANRARTVVEVSLALLIRRALGAKVRLLQTAQKTSAVRARAAVPWRARALNTEVRVGTSAIGGLAGRVVVRIDARGAHALFAQAVGRAERTCAVFRRASC